MTFLRVWIRVTVLDLVYKLHCEGADRVCAHGTANSHTCDGTFNATYSF